MSSNLAPGTKHTVTIKLGSQPAQAPHLTYVSKMMTDVQPTPAGLSFRVKTKTKARFAVSLVAPAIALIEPYLLRVFVFSWQRKVDTLRRRW